MNNQDLINQKPTPEQLERALQDVKKAERALNLISSAYDNAKLDHDQAKLALDVLVFDMHHVRLAIEREAAAEPPK